MQFRLNAATDLATFIVFDPASIPAGTVNNPNFEQMLDTLAIEGRGLFFFPGGDCECDFLFFVDEPPDDRLRQHLENGVADALLRVPSGRLVATGYEDLTSVYRPDTFQPDMGQAAELPAGNYHVDAFGLNWGEEVEEEVSRRAGPGDERFETVFGTLMGVVMFSTVFIAPGLCVCTWINWSWREMLWLILGVILFNSVFWLLCYMLTKKSDAWQRMAALRIAVKSEYPDVVIVLRRYPDSELPTTITPGRFGAGR